LFYLKASSVDRDTERLAATSSETCASAAAVPFAPSASDKWTKYDLHIKTMSPVIITARTVGNFVETTDYIPGTYLLPIITRAVGLLRGDTHSDHQWRSSRH